MAVPSPAQPAYDLARSRWTAVVAVPAEPAVRLARPAVVRSAAIPARRPPSLPPTRTATYTAILRGCRTSGDLCARLGVSRRAMRRVVADLTDLGLVVAVRGVGIRPVHAQCPPKRALVATTELVEDSAERRRMGR